MSKNNDVLGRMGPVLCVVQELTCGDYKRYIFWSSIVENKVVFLLGIII